METGKETLTELLLGIVISGIILILPGIIFFKGSYFPGLLLGVLIAGLMTFHMYRTIDRSLDMDKKEATGYMKRKTILRFILMILGIAAAVVFPQIFHLAGVMLGILTLKFSAYLQPLTHKFFTQKFINKGR